ncbi:MAG: hypothetical protein GY854_24065 [Deltaproteobacteria bacterium]|nr:hypothetical protein [Deltaproteobacteria bacterium]
MEKNLESLKMIGRRIREIREERNWNRGRLENELDGGMTCSCLYYFEHHKRTPSLKSLFLLGDVFSIDPMLFFIDPLNNERHRIIAEVLSRDCMAIVILQAMVSKLTEVK